MLSIQRLLNPEPERQSTPLSSIPRSTGTFAIASSTTVDTRNPKQLAKAGRRARQMKSNGGRPPQHVVNFAPHEFSMPTPGLTVAQQNELGYWHKHFKLAVCKDKGGLIEDHARHIEYYTEKTDWFKKTGRRGFQVFEYEFTKPDPVTGNGTKWVAMWDYEIGLVRIGQFFKSCEGHNKQSPKDALTKSQGLEQLCPNVTGGITSPYGAQGYWVPFACARALCLTFCHEIRWALTPIFGYNFVHDCVPPDNPRFKSYKIHHSLVERARSDELAYVARLAAHTMPDSAVASEVMAVPRQQATQIKLPTKRRARIKHTEPKPIAIQPAEQRLSVSPGMMYSPPVSPKSTPERLEPVTATHHVGWIPVNQLFSKPYKALNSPNRKRPHSGTGAASADDEDDKFTLKPSSKKDKNKKTKEKLKSSGEENKVLHSPMTISQQVEMALKPSFIINSPPASTAKNSPVSIIDHTMDVRDSPVIDSALTSPMIHNPEVKQNQSVAGEPVYSLDEFEAAQILLHLNKTSSADSTLVEEDASNIQE